MKKEKRAITCPKNYLAGTGLRAMGCKCETRREESLTRWTEAKAGKLIGRIAGLPVQVRK